MINFTQLRVFYQVAESLNVTKAAAKLCITQPAASTQAKLFAESCALKLFKKVRQKIYLTEEGKVLYDYAREIFEAEKKMEGVIEDLRELRQGSVQLGTINAYDRSFFSNLMTNFHNAYPHIKIKLTIGSSQEMIRNLLDCKIELAIISKAEKNPAIRFIPFSDLEMLIIVPPEHHLVQKKAITFKELAAEPIIMREKGSASRKALIELFTKHKCAPNFHMETGNIELIKELVQRGEGISFLAYGSVSDELKEKKLATVTLKGHKLCIQTYIAYLKNQPLSPSAQAFLEVLGNLAPKDKSFYGIEAFNAQQ